MTTTVGGGAEVIEIVITGNSSSGVAAAERQAAALKGIGTAAAEANGRISTLGAGLQSRGRAFESFGRTMTRSVTLPIVAVGAAAGKMAYDFQKSMLLVQTHTDTSRKNLDLYKKSILEMGSSGRYTQGPTELANAMYHVASDGYKGAKAMGILKQAADLAMVGQADMATTTYAMVSALKSQIRGLHDAHDATKQMNAVVGTGDMQMQDFVSSLSTGILPAAKNMNLSFKDVGAALAFMTQRGIPAQQAAYRLSMNFQQLVPYTDKAKSAFDTLGLGYDSLGKKIHGPHGFLDALTLLQDHLDKFDRFQQGTLIRDMFGGGRTSRGMLQLLQNLHGLQDNYKRINDLQGKTQENLDKFRSSNVFKLHSAWVSVQTDLVKIGGEILPHVVPLMDKLSTVAKDIANWFDHLSPSAKGTVLEFAALAAVIGPLLSIFGRWMILLGALVKYLGGVWTKSQAGTVVLDEQTVALNAATGATERLALALEQLIAGYQGVGAAAAEATTAGGAYTTMETTQVDATLADAAAQRQLATSEAEVGGAGLLGKGGLMGGPMGMGTRLSKGFAGLQIAGMAYLGGQLAGSAIGGRGGAVASSTATGAGLGFLAGSVVPGIGNLAGAGVGAALGSLYGSITGSKTDPRQEVAKKMADEYSKAAAKVFKRGFEGRNLHVLGGSLADMRITLQAEIAAHADQSTIDKTRHTLEQATHVKFDITKARSDFQTNLDELRSGTFRTMGDINRISKSNLEEMGLGWKKGSMAWRHAAADNLRAIASAMARNKERSGHITKKGLEEIQHLTHHANLVEGRDPWKIEHSFERSWANAHKITKKSIQHLLDTVDQLPPAMRTRFEAMTLSMAAGLVAKKELPVNAFLNLRSELESHSQKLRDNMHNNFQTITNFSLTELDRLLSGGLPKGQKFSQTLTQDFVNAQTGGTDAIGKLGDSLNHALDALGLTPIKGFGTIKGDKFNAKSGGAHSNPKAQGGMVGVPGQGVMDNVPLMVNGGLAAMVAPGEELMVVNRHQRPLLDAAVAGMYGMRGMHDFFSQVNTPHYMAAGGKVSPYSYPFPKGTPIGRTDEGIDVQGATGTPVGAIGSGHVTSAVNLFGPQYGSTSQGLVYQLAGGAPKGFSPSSPYVYVYEGLNRVVGAGAKVSAGQLLGHIASSFPGIETGWAAGPGGPALAHNHYTEGQETPEGKSFARFLATLLGGGAVQAGGAFGAGAVPVPKLPRIKVTGPAGPLRDMAQGSADKMLHAAQHYLDKHAPQGGAGGAGFSFGSGAWQDEMRKIAAARHWNLGDWQKLVNQESSGDPTAVNTSSGAFGLGQFLGATKAAYAKFGATSTNPVRQIDAMAKYISDRYGNPTKAWAHEVANNWYAGGGILGGGAVDRYASGKGPKVGPNTLVDASSKKGKQIQADKATIKARKKTLDGLLAAWKKARASHSLADDMTALTNLDTFWQQYGDFGKGERRHVDALRTAYINSLNTSAPGDDRSALKALVTYEDDHGAISPGPSKTTKQAQEEAHKRLLKHLLKQLASAYKTPQISDDIGTLTKIDDLYERFGIFNSTTTPKWDALKKVVSSASPGSAQELAALKALVTFERKWGSLTGSGRSGKGPADPTDTTTAGPDLQALLDVQTQLNQQLAENLATQTAQFGTIAAYIQQIGHPYVGAFGGGGVVPGPIGRPYSATVHGGEVISPAGAAAPINITLVGDIGSVVEAYAPGMVQAANKQIGRGRRVMTFAPGG